MNLKNLNFSAFFIFCALLFSACSDDNDSSPLPNGELSLMFESKFGDQSLTLGTEYTTPEGEQVIFSQFRYILSNVILIQDDGTEYLVPDSYYFMGQPADGEKREMIQVSEVPGGTYIGIKFAVGVDEATNSSTDTFEKGELKAGIGMDWGWNSGYKFINWEGTYTNTTLGSQVPFKLHVGTNANYKVVEHIFAQPITISGNGSSMVHFEVMADRVFQGIQFNEIGLNFAEGTFTGIMVGPADKAAQVADNYAQMFMLHHAEGI